MSCQLSYVNTENLQILTISSEALPRKYNPFIYQTQKKIIILFMDLPGNMANIGKINIIYRIQQITFMKIYEIHEKYSYHCSKNKYQSHLFDTQVSIIKKRALYDVFRLFICCYRVLVLILPYTISRSVSYFVIQNAACCVKCHSFFGTFPLFCT